MIGNWLRFYNLRVLYSVLSLHDYSEKIRIKYETVLIEISK